MIVQRFVLSKIKMRVAVILVFLLTSSNQVFTRDNLNIGLFAGTSYYLGDINPSLHFYNLSPAMGAIVKYNINAHYSLRTSLNYGQVRADDLEFSNILHQTRGASFVNNFYDFSLQGEFNFKPFSANLFKRPFTPYVTAGVAYTIMQGSPGSSVNFLNIPFGAGIKYGISSRISVGMEWILKKSFIDVLDGVKSFGQFNSSSLVHNNDWVSLAGFFYYH